jgi:capsular exopolysaccharide synthesis family protein
MSDIKKRVIEDEDDFDVKKLISRFLDHWKLFVISVIGCLIAAFLFIRYSTPMYKVHAQVLVEDDQKNTSSPFSFIGGSQMQDLSSLFGIQSNVYNELGILETRDLLDKVVRDMHLNITYYRKGDVRSVELYNKSPFRVVFIPLNDSTTASSIDIIFPKNGEDNNFIIGSDDIEINTKEGAFGDSIHTNVGTLVLSKTGQSFEDADYTFTLASPDATIADLSKDLTSEIGNDQTTIVSLTLNTAIPQKGEDILQKLITSYIERNLNEKNKISDSTLTFIDGRIKIVSKDLNDIEASIQGFKQQNKIADIDEQSKALISNTSEYYNKLNDVDVQLNIVNTMLSSVKEDIQRPVPTLVNTDPTFIALVQKYNALLSQKDKLLLSTTESNPIVRNIDVQLESVRNDMIKSLESQQQALQVTRNKIVGENSVLNNMVSNVPVQERKYIDLSRERDVKQALYLFLLQQKETTAITKASNIPSASVIAAPKTEYKPYFPSKLLILAIGLVLGFVIPVAYIILKYTLNNRIISRDDITQETDCPILAEIGHSEKINGLLMEEHGRTVLAEQFRVFRTNMDFLTGQKSCPKILITSSMSGEGKSFIAGNLAQVYAYSGKKVLLMEMDLRKPKLSAMMGIPNNNGFTNYIISQKPIRDFIQQLSDSKNIYIMSSGPVPPNPAELLLLPKVSDMFEELTEDFDIIIIDSPPIGPVADAQILSKHSDVNLYITRQEYTFKNSLEIVNDIIDNKKFGNLYLVVNDVKKGTSYRYGYGYGHGYGYGYGYENGNGIHSKKRKGIVRKLLKERK